MALSTFFRTSLSLDPSADVTPGRGDRPPAPLSRHREGPLPGPPGSRDRHSRGAGAARVPALILQPLVENAIKYGVSATTRAVTAAIRARRWTAADADRRHQPRRGGRREGPAAPTARGTGVGLANVCQRLEAHFGKRAECRFGPIEGGYRFDRHAVGSTMTDEPPLKGPDCRRRAARAERLQMLLARSTASTWSAPPATAKARSRMAEALAPDLVLLDIAMPGLDGIEVAARLRGTAEPRPRSCSSPPSTSSPSPPSRSRRSTI